MTVEVCPCHQTKYTPRKSQTTVQVCPCHWDKVQPIKPGKKSDDSGSVSVPLDKVQNGDIEVNVKQTDDGNDADESDETDELFDDPPLDIF